MLKIYENSDSFLRAQERLAYFFPEASSQIDIEASKNLFSNFKLELPISLLNRVQDFVGQFYDITTSVGYQNRVLDPQLKGLSYESYKPSVLCCFDFHYDAQADNLKLIEVNTNASGYLIGSLAFEGWDISTVPYKDELLRSFKNSGLIAPSTLYIMDEKPTEQKMYLEFLLYQEFLKKHTEVQIIDSKELDHKLGEGHLSPSAIAIYNRDTDFYLKDLPHLLEAYRQNQLLLSPHPMDYDLLAKKSNLDLLQTWQESNEDFNACFLRSGLVREHFSTYEDLVKAKKSLFFKPPTAFGGKSIYKGSSVSNKYLQHIWDDNFLFQQSFPAGKFTCSVDQSWKYDLRFYTYDGLVQFYIARVYQGQITNFKTSGGGFAPVVFA